MENWIHAQAGAFPPFLILSSPHYILHGTAASSDFIFPAWSPWLTAPEYLYIAQWYFTWPLEKLSRQDSLLSLKFFQISFVALIVSARGLLEVVLVRFHFVCKVYSMINAKNQSWHRSFSQHNRDLAKGLTGAGVSGNLWWLSPPIGAPAHLANPKLPVLNFRDQLW